MNVDSNNRSKDEISYVYYALQGIQEAFDTYNEGNILKLGVRSLGDAEKLPLFHLWLLGYFKSIYRECLSLCKSKIMKLIYKIKTR